MVFLWLYTVDAPAYYVFCAGLTIIGIFLSMTWFFNYQYQRGALQRCLQLGHVSSSIKYLCVSVLLFGIISTIGLPLLVSKLVHYTVDTYHTHTYIYLYICFPHRVSLILQAILHCMYTRPIGFFIGKRLLSLSM
jgi:hypothetical protein